MSAGRGVRFPTVAELFLGSVTATQIVVNDPNLKPEISDAVDLSVEYQPAFGRVRVSLFQDDVRDTIWNQTNSFVFRSPSIVQNIGRVRTRGIETAFSFDGVGIDTLAHRRQPCLCEHAHPAKRESSGVRRQPLAARS